MSTASAPISLREILDAPIHFLRQHFKALIVIALLGEAIAVIPILIFQILTNGQTPDLTVPSDFGLFMVQSYGAMATQWLLRLLPALALYWAVMRILDGDEPPSVGEAYSAALQPGLYFTYVIQGGVIFLGSLCCVLPGLALAALFSLTAPIMFHEKRRWMSALERSYDLVWTNPSQQFSGSTLFTVLIAGAVYIALSFALTTIAALPATVWTGMETFSNTIAGMPPTVILVPPWLMVIGAVLGVFASSVVDLYPVVAFTMLYREVIRRRDGGDLADAIQERLET